MVAGDYKADLAGDVYNFCGYKDFLRNKMRVNMLTNRNDVNCNNNFKTVMEKWW